MKEEEEKGEEEEEGMKRGGEGGEATGVGGFRGAETERKGGAKEYERKKGQKQKE